MFELEVLHAEDMIERMEVEVKLSFDEREQLPLNRRVPIDEAVPWEDEVVRKLEAIGAYAKSRYDQIQAQHSKDVELGGKDGLALHLARFRRIVQLMKQLDSVPHVGRGVGLTNSDTASQRSVPRNELFDVFISHASEDKDTVALPLYAALTAQGVRVWLDVAVLELGDSLRRKIDEGLARSRFGVVILSPHFLSKEWPQRELDGLFARESNSGDKAILPVWHNLSADTLVRQAPLLADRLSVNTSSGMDAVANAIAKVIQRK